MTQDEFNQHTVNILANILEHLGKSKPSEPKHGIIGDPLADQLEQFRWKLPIKNRVED